MTYPDDHRMRTTKDTLTGKPFRWNSVVVVRHEGRQIVTPARHTGRTATHLDPSRVRPALLAELNEGVTILDKA